MEREQEEYLQGAMSRLIGLSKASDVMFPEREARQLIDDIQLFINSLNERVSSLEGENVISIPLDDVFENPNLHRDSGGMNFELNNTED